MSLFEHTRVFVHTLYFLFSNEQPLCALLLLRSILTPPGSHGHWKGDGHARHYIPKPAKRQCSEGYTGALSHSFDFGTITATGDVTATTQAKETASTTTTGVSDASATIQASGAVDKEEFCGNLTSLEAYMDNKLTSSNDAKYVGSYECACGESD